MKRSSPLITVTRGLAAVGLMGLLLCLSQCGESGGIHEDAGGPTPVCELPRDFTCGSTSECGSLAIKPICSQESVQCVNGLCDFQPLGGTGCPCMQYATRPCTLPGGGQGTQACGKLTDDTTDWCECT